MKTAYTAHRVFMILPPIRRVSNALSQYHLFSMRRHDTSFFIVNEECARTFSMLRIITII